MLILQMYYAYTNYMFYLVFLILFEEFDNTILDI